MFQASASAAHKKLWMRTSSRFCEGINNARPMQAMSRAISKAETAPRSGIRRQRALRSRTGAAAASMHASGAHPDRRLAFAAKKSGRAEHHHQQKQHEEK